MKNPASGIALKTGDESVFERPEAENLPAMAKYFEKENQPEKAAKIYEKLIKTGPLKENNFNRLMLIYRKQKDYKDELRIIDTGIKMFEDFFRPSVNGMHKNIISLSKKINVLIGLTDKKGKNLTDSSVIEKWKKRREIVLKKMK